MLTDEAPSFRFLLPDRYKYFYNDSKVVRRIFTLQVIFISEYLEFI